MECGGQSDREILTLLYQALGGVNWNNVRYWVSDRPLHQWTGVTTDSQGRVLELNLSYGGLVGNVPSALGQLQQLTTLWLHNNPGLSGPLPQSLTALSLQDLSILSTNLCILPTDSVRTWLNGIQSHREVVWCPIQQEVDALTAMHEAFNRRLERAHWGTDAPLESWRGITLDAGGRVTRPELEE